MRILILLLGLCLDCCFALGANRATQHSSRSACQVRPTVFQGWQAEEVSNDWLRLTLVPELGGRLMQVHFGEHDYLFVNPEFAGRYLPPPDGADRGKWFNYGGDKIWPLPEGSEDEHHWPGPIADVLDDGVYQWTVISQGQTCRVKLDGQADQRTGLRYSREISIGANSPEIEFLASMTNAVARPIEWSVQSVTQYDTAAHNAATDYNRDFWAFAPVNPQSLYPDGYRVRAGLADDPSFELGDGLFQLHWMYLENEVWLDSTAGWLAVIDRASHYAMVERFQYVKGGNYPGGASVIFYKNGGRLQLDHLGMPVLGSTNPRDTPFYMEAEINSPMMPLLPGETYSMKTTWFPSRAGGDFRGVAEAGVIAEPFAAWATPDGIALSGDFAVFFPGNLKAFLFNAQGIEIDSVSLSSVDPSTSFQLNQQIKAPSSVVRISIHLIDEQGIDRGSLGEAPVRRVAKDS